MKLSIFTPCHDAKYLNDLWKSLQAQTYKDFEWIILLNNGATYISPAPNVKVVTSAITGNIGALKKEACGHATGAILVEVDSDDIITPNCLEEVAKAFEDPEIGFAYSDNFKYTDNFIPYNKACGWEYSMFNWKGKDYFVMHSFTNNLPTEWSFIWYGPDHIRAFRRDVYNQVGGHDEKLEVLDDQDLFLRIYLVSKVKFINKCLYGYRIHND